MDNLGPAIRAAVETELAGKDILEVVYVVASGRKGDRKADLLIGSTHSSPVKAREIMFEEALRKVKNA